MKGNTKNKIRSTVFWSGLVSAILIFIQNVALLFGIELSQETISQIIACVNSLLAVLVFAGILVDPNKVDSFQNFSVKFYKKQK